MGTGSDGPRENESSHHAVWWGKLDMVIPLAAGTGEVRVGTQGRSLPAHARTEELGGLQSMGSQMSWTQLNTHTQKCLFF